MIRWLGCCLLMLTGFSVWADSDYQDGLRWMRQPRYELAFASFEKACQSLNHEPYSVEYVSSLIRAAELDVLFARSQYALRRLSIARDVLRKFYENLGKGMTKSAALRQAKREYLSQSKSSESANPFYWSGLVLTGDVSPIHLIEKSTYLWVWVLFAVLLLVAIVAVKKRLLT